jgi:hypothetical protein
MKYEIREQSRQLRSALNRRDPFTDLYQETRVLKDLLNNEGDNISILELSSPNDPW